MISQRLLQSLRRLGFLNKQTAFNLAEYDETIREVLDSGGAFRIYPRGTSMLPLLREGVDSVMLEKPDDVLKKGDIAFYRRDNGGYVLHRVIKAKDGYVMCGDNHLMLEKGIEQRQIIGRVCAIYRGDKQLPMNGLKYRFYCLLWKSFFIRRVYFRLRSLKNGRK